MKQKALKFINPLLLLLFLVAVTAMIMYKITHGSETWGEIHEFAGILFFFVGILHLYFNWSWIRSNILGKKKHK